MDPRKLKQLQGAVAGIKRDYGHNSVATIQNGSSQIIPHVGSGSLSLDVALGVGGFARKNIHEIFGGPDTGKTSISLLTIAQAQREGGVCVFINADGHLDTVWAKKLGVNIEELTIIQPTDGEMTFNIAERFLCSGVVDVLVVDSVAAMVPKAELSGDFGDSEREFLHAQMMSSGLRRLNTFVTRSNSACIFTNQTRMKWGQPGEEAREESTGGNALKFYASSRIRTIEAGELKDGDSTYGSKIMARVIRNKVAAPFNNAMLAFNINSGFDSVNDILSMCLKDGLVKKHNNEIIYQDTVIGKNINEAYNHLAKNKELLNKLESDNRVFHGIASHQAQTNSGLQLTG